MDPTSYSYSVDFIIPSVTDDVTLTKLTDGVRISELTRYEVTEENLQERDSLLVPISYNGATKAISIGDVMMLFENKDVDGAQNQAIQKNRDDIAYLFSRLQELADERDITLQGIIESQAITDEVQNTNIAKNAAYIASQATVNLNQQDEINGLNTNLSNLSNKLDNDVSTLTSKIDNDVATLTGKVNNDVSSLSDRINNESNKNEQNAQNILEQTNINITQQTEINNLSEGLTNTISSFEGINPWGVYNG